MTQEISSGPAGSLFGRSRGRVDRALTDREEVACPMCATVPRQFGVDFQGLQLARCESCGLEFQSPRPTFEQLERAVYGDGYHPPEHAQLDRVQKANYARQLTRLEVTVGPGRRSLLDVGCGAAAFIRYGAERGWVVDGTDIVLTEWARQTNARLWQGQLPAIDFGTIAEGGWPRYDVVRFNHVLEHTRDPLAELRRAYELLAPGGLVLVGVPNIGGLSIRLKSWQSRLGVKRKAWKHYGALHHLWFFTPDTLARLIRTAGFDVVRRETPVVDRHKGGALGRSLRRALRAPLEWSHAGGILDLYAQRPFDNSPASVVPLL